MKNNNENFKLKKTDIISCAEQNEIIAKAILKYKDLNKVSKLSGIPLWLLQNALKGNEIRKSQYEKLLWMRDRLEIKKK